jgi:hypothetical protein
VNRPRILIFGKESYREWSNRMKTVYLDGTFRLASPLFSQIYVFLARRPVPNGEFRVVPILQVLLPDKSQRTYKFMFAMIKMASF